MSLVFLVCRLHEQNVVNHGSCALKYAREKSEGISIMIVA